MNQIIEPIQMEPPKPAEQVMWHREIKLKDGKTGSIEFDLEILSKQFNQPIKKVIVQKVYGSNNRLRIGLVINGPDVIIEEPTSNGKQEQSKTRGSGSL